MLMQFKNERLDESMSRSARFNGTPVGLNDRIPNDKRSVKKKTAVVKKWSFYFGLGFLFIISTLYTQSNITAIYIAQYLLEARRTVSEDIFLNYRTFVGILFSTSRCYQLLFDAILIKAGVGKLTPLRAQLGNLQASMVSLITSPVRLNTFLKRLESSSFGSQLTIFDIVRHPCDGKHLTGKPGFGKQDCIRFAHGGFEGGLLGGYSSAITHLESFTNRLSLNTSSLAILGELGFRDLQFLVSRLAYPIGIDFQVEFEKSVIPLISGYQTRIWRTVTDLQYWILGSCLGLTLGIIYRIYSIGTVIFECPLRLPVLTSSESKALRFYIQNI